MEKRILVGSIIAVIILLLMPSIPAIQINTLKEGTQQNNNDLKIKLSNIIIEIFPELPEHFPLLYLIVYSIALFRLIRALLSFDLSTEPDDFPPFFTITNRLLFIRAAFLINGLDWWVVIWKDISDHFGWGWFE